MRNAATPGWSLLFQHPAFGLLCACALFADWVMLPATSDLAFWSRRHSWVYPSWTAYQTVTGTHSNSGVEVRCHMTQEPPPGLAFAYPSNWPWRPYKRGLWASTSEVHEHRIRIWAGTADLTPEKERAVRNAFVKHAAACASCSPFVPGLTKLAAADYRTTRILPFGYVHNVAALLFSIGTAYCLAAQPRRATRRIQEARAQRDRCGGCRYDLSGVPGAVTQIGLVKTCPECGRLSEPIRTIRL